MFMHFKNRVDAGEKLSEAIIKSGLDLSDALILGIPRGGVVVAYHVAANLGLELDVIVSRKLRAPYNPELAIGAISEFDAVFINKGIVAELGVPKNYIDDEVEHQRRVLNDYIRKFRGNRKLELKGRKAVLVDDGIATGATVIAAAIACRNGGADKVIVATPVVADDVYYFVRKYCDELIYVIKPAILYAVGMFYYDFTQTTDREVIELLIKAGKKPSQT